MSDTKAEQDQQKPTDSPDEMEYQDDVPTGADDVNARINPDPDGFMPGGKIR
jgi:hypothetical protein